MKLRDYQHKLIEDTKELINNNKNDIVWAACPSSGKTFTLINFIQQHPTKKFLILTHGTTILKDQWNKELTKHDIDCSQEIGVAQVTYGLPQSLRKDEIKQLQGIDFLIIDEAHEFTFAKTKKDKTGMVEQIISKVQPKVRIYLTGTPSKFIKVGDKYDVLCVAGLELIKAGNISDLYIGLVSTNAEIQEDDYNSEGDINESRVKTLEDSVDGDLDNLLEAIVLRLTGIFKNSPIPNQIIPKKLKSWASVFTTLDKTMIACRSIAQATKVEQYFNRAGISCVGSNNHNDPDSLNIKEFMNNPDIKVLVVVDRGILGFNMENLVNVVDLTCSRNIDRIYQLYARVMRKNDKNSQKFFFKFSTEENMTLFRFYMNAALCLLKEDFIMKYNGKNLNNMKIPVIISKENKEKINRKSKKNDKKNKQLIFNPDIGLYDYVQAAKVLDDTFNKIGQELNEYAYVTFGDIKSKIFGTIIHDSSTTKQNIINFIVKYNRRPNSRSIDSNEKRLGKQMIQYCSEKSGTYDKSFVNKLKELNPNIFISSSDIAKMQLEELYKANAPLKKSNVLYSKHLSYHKKGGETFDEIWSNLMKNKYPDIFLTRIQKLFNRMIECMPKNVKFKENQLYKGDRHKYTFICDKYGEFNALPTNLIRKSWKIGISGHPLMGIERVTSFKRKKLKNLDTNKIYNSLTETRDIVGYKNLGNLSRAIKNKGTCAGYRWAYVEDEE